MKVGLYFGSFNPVHVGHLIIANHMAEFAGLDQVWLVLTPHNPFKEKKTLLADYTRLELLRLAIENYPKLRASDIEFKLPQPNYTVHTLAHLHEKFPSHQFALIMGTDNLRSLPKWKNADVILENHEILVYPRLGDDGTAELAQHPKVSLINAPVIEISSTFIRKSLAERKDMRALLTEKVWHYIDTNNLYRQA